MKKAYIILPNQLFKDTAWIDGRDVYLVEEERYFTDFSYHRKKLILHRASMKYYEDYLKERGYRVHYREYRSRWKEELKGYELVLIRPYDTILEKRLSVTTNYLESPAFIGGELPKGKKPFMATYYKEQRRRLGILIDGNGKPMGGKWSYDRDNRKRYPEGHEFPKLPRCSNSYIEEATAYVNENFPENPGDAEGFYYPVTHEDARLWLDDFIENRLRLFGDYEDAIGRDEEVLYHSLLSPVINIGLLTPMEVVEAVLKAREIPLNCLEGFIRQVVGWREFMLQIYITYGEEERKSNFFENEKILPKELYTGETGILPVDNVVEKVLKNAYSHHIERLMVMGNYMLLMDYRPQEVYRWFMEMYIDAYDWVMVPNVYGMSQYADGGIFATKPYISSSNYILKMSDFEKGKWCDIWNDLYWGFLAKHEAKLRNNPRMGLMMNQLARRREKAKR